MVKMTPDALQERRLHRVALKRPRNDIKQEIARMKQSLKRWAAMLGVGAIAAAFTAGALAQERPAGDETVKQIKLTEAQVKSFISAQPDLATVAGKLQEAGDTPDPALQAELDGIAKKHGFTSFGELDDVAANISIVMSGLDAKTGTFTEPVDALKKELADVEADQSIGDADKKQLVDELNEAIKATPAVEYKENIDLVKAHREEIEKALE